MKTILRLVLALVLVGVGVVGTLAVQKLLVPSVQLTATSVQEQLSGCSELATAKLEYRGLVQYQDGDIDWINKKTFTMIYDAQVRAGVDLSKATVAISGKSITVTLPQATSLGIQIDPASLQFYDSTYSLFNWENKDDTAKALQAANDDAASKIDSSNLIQAADQQAKSVVSNLLLPFTQDAGGYSLSIVTA